MSCSICLENLNENNKTMFCCSTFHKRCILQCLKITGRCPLCRKQYNIFKQKLNDESREYHNLDDIRNDVLEEHNESISEVINSLAILQIDHESRLIMIENKIGKKNEIIKDKLLKSHTVRISFLEKSLNNMESEIKKIKKYVLKKK